jgi:hypothetical protein
MKKNQLGSKNYSSPQAQILKIVPETVLCQSKKDEVTGLTGANWYVGDDAEW